MNPELRSIVADILDLDPSEVRDDLGPGLGDRWDSLSHLKIMSAVEETFGLRLSMDEIQGVDSFAALARIVAGRR
ncbi:MAG: acyl carrier protein [Gemmatimonadota bacterium]